jgi:hypothetical protein
MMKILLGFLVSVALFGALGAGESGGQYEVTYEVFSLPIAKAAKLKRENLGGEESSQRLVRGVEKGEVRQEKFVSMKMIAGHSGSVEETEEFIYPTEYDYGMLETFPNEGEIRGIPFLLRLIPVPVTFAVFDTKNVGDSLECEVNASQIRMTIEHVEKGPMDSFGKGVSEWRFPRLSVQRFNGGSSFVVGKPALIGAVSPPKDLQKEKGVKNVWLAFVTVKELKK